MFPCKVICRHGVIVVGVKMGVSCKKWSLGAACVGKGDASADILYETAD